VLVGEHQRPGLAGHERVQLVVLEAVVHRHERDPRPRRGEQRDGEQRAILTDIDERRVPGELGRTRPGEAPEVGPRDRAIAFAHQDALVEPRLDHLDQ
jgi:hypothetical protein